MYYISAARCDVSHRVTFVSCVKTNKDIFKPPGDNNRYVEADY